MDNQGTAVAQGMAMVSQTRLQRYLMQDLLGIETEFLFLTAKADWFSAEQRTLSWAAAFCAVELGNQPGFVNAWIKGVLGLG